MNLFSLFIKIIQLLFFPTL